MFSALAVKFFTTSATWEAPKSDGRDTEIVPEFADQKQSCTFDMEYARERT